MLHESTNKIDPLSTTAKSVKPRFIYDEGNESKMSITDVTILGSKTLYMYKSKHFYYIYENHSPTNNSTIY